jgi:hypothetical protein
MSFNSYDESLSLYHLADVAVVAATVAQELSDEEDVDLTLELPNAMRRCSQDRGIET